MRTTLLLVLGVALAACGSDDPAELDAGYIVFGSSASTVTVAWDADPAATTFTIERGASDADLAVIATLPATSAGTSYLDTGLAPETAYSYRFTTTLADGSTAVEPIEHTRTTAEPIVITDDPPALDVPVVATVGAAGATIAVDVIHATVVVPPGAAADGTELTIQPVGSPFDDDPDVTGLEVTASAALAQPIAMVFAIDDLDAVTPDNLAIAVQADDGSWISQPREVDADARTITFTMTADVATLPAVWATPGRRHAALVLRETFILPRHATVTVRKTLALTPYGRFTDEKGCQDIETEALCLSLAWAARSLSGERQPVVETHPLANFATGYERIWLVDRAIGGSASVGRVTAGPGVGATYTAPPAAPSTSAVEVQFTSVNTATGQTAHAVAARIAIHDAGSVKVTARFHAGAGSGWSACPFAFVDVSDTITFSITMDAELRYHVEAIENHPTTLGPLQFYGSATGGWNIEPELFTMSSGYAVDYDVNGESTIAVVVYGTSVGGQCYMNTDYGPEAGDGLPYQPMFNFLIHPDLSVENYTAMWTITAELIETP